MLSPDATVNERASLLAEAEALVNGDRNAQYGDPRQDFQRTADMWSAYLGHPVAMHDVAAMMAILKVSRIRWSPTKRDSWADLAGYAACGWDCASTIEAPEPVVTDPVVAEVPANDLELGNEVVTLVTTKPPRSAKRLQSHACPDCGKTFASPNGLAIHRGRSHPGSGAKPVPVAVAS